MSLHGTDFEEIAAYPEQKLPFCDIIQQDKREYQQCVDCDSDACRRVLETGETLIYKCRHGLTEVICPLYNFGTLTGYIMMGQVGYEELDFTEAERFLYKLTSDARLARSTAAGITRISADMLQSYVRIMTICAEYMTLTNALPSRAPRLPELAKMYLHERYGEKITIQDICRELGCSKSALLVAFKNEYGTTLNDYLCQIRIEKAKKLLTSTNMSISAIADATGFYDQSYFSKVFSSRLGMTPSEYRKENTNEDNTHV